MTSLLTRLSLLLLVALAPALGLSIYIEIQARHSRERAVHEQAMRLIDRASSDQQGIAEDARQMLTSLASMAADLSGNPVACRERLENLLHAFERYRALSIVGADGRVACGAPPDPRPANDGDLISAAMSSGLLTAGRYDLTEATQVFALPYRDRTGAPAGIVKAALSLDWLQRQIEALALPQGAALGVVAQDGTILARRPEPSAFVGKRMPPAIKLYLDGETSGTAEATGLDGVARIFAFSPFRAQSNGFALALGLDRDAAFVDIAKANRRDAYLIAVGAVLGTLLLALGADRLVRRPVRDLLQAAGRLQQGESAPRWGSVDDLSEFGRLGAAFDAMGQQQEQRARALNDALATAEQTRLKLVESEARLRLALASADVAVWELDLAGRQVWLEESAVKLLGIDAPADVWLPYDSPALLAWFATIHPDDESRRRMLMVAMDDGGSLQLSVEYRIRDPAGGWRWISDSGAVIALDVATHRPLRLVGVSRDVTAARDAQAAGERIVAERSAALRDSEARFRGIFDSAFQFTGLLTPGGVLLEANRAARQFGGLTLADVLNRPVWDTYWWAGDPTRVARLRRSVDLAAAGQFVRYEVEVRGAAGATALIDFSLKPMRGENGDVVMLIAEGRDITERSRLQAQLAQAQKMEAVGQLTGGVAHDFNNLLQAVTGNLDLIVRLVEPRDDERVLRLARNALRAAARGASLTQQLLAFSRKQILRPERVWANKLTGEMGELLRRAAGETIGLHLRADDDLWPCHVDPAQFQSALLNLVINARDAMPDGGTLNVSASNVALGAPQAATMDTAPGDYVRIDVADTGTGIPADLLARIFEPFFTTKDVGKGSGLGLPMVHGFARQSGGAVTVSSLVGLGTTMSMFLPRDAGTQVDQDGEPATVALAQGSTIGLTILLVEDDPDVLDAVEFGLIDSGHRVRVARDGREALAVLDSGERLDLLLSDLALPGGLSGVEVAVAALARHPELRVLLTSGYVDADNDTSLGGFEVLRKPFANAHLLQRVAEIAAARGAFA